MTMARLDEAHAMTAFLGEVAIALFEHVKHPARLRTRALLGTLERAGVGAIPIVALLSFLLGIVVATRVVSSSRIMGPTSSSPGW